MYYYVKYKSYTISSSAVSIYKKDRYYYIIFDDYESAYWGFSHAPNSIAFGKVDESIFFNFTILEEKDCVKQTENDSKES